MDSLTITVTNPSPKSGLDLGDALRMVLAKAGRGQRIQPSTTICLDGVLPPNNVSVIHYATTSEFLNLCSQTLQLTSLSKLGEVLLFENQGTMKIKIFFVLRKNISQSNICIQIKNFTSKMIQLFRNNQTAIILKSNISLVK